MFHNLWYLILDFLLCTPCETLCSLLWRVLRALAIFNDPKITIALNGILHCLLHLLLDIVVLFRDNSIVPSEDVCTDMLNNFWLWVPSAVALVKCAVARHCDLGYLRERAAPERPQYEEENLVRMHHFKEL